MIVPAGGPHVNVRQVARGFHETSDGKVWAIQNFH
jgi:hypothetical protein